MILVDTSVWIDFFLGIESPEAVWLIDAIRSDEDLGICGPILMEIRQGITSQKDVAVIEDKLAPLLYLPTHRKTYLHAADIYRSARAKGKIVRKAMDCLIAACAVEHRAKLLHRDKDFAAIAEVSELEFVQP